MSAAEMVNRCFRTQHPEAYGRPEVAGPPAEEAMGEPEAGLAEP